MTTASSPPHSLVESSDNFWRKDPPQLAPNGVLIKGGLFPHQRQWWDLPNFIRVLVGGYGSGKTNVLGKRMIALALHNAPAPVAIVSPSFPLARETIIPTLHELLAGKKSIYGRDFWWTHNRSTSVFRMRFRGREGRVIVYSGDKPLSLRGPNLAAAGIDEPFIQDKEVFLQMVARVRHPEAKKREINLTGTPEQLNWGYDLCIGEDKAHQDVEVVRASTRSNLILDPGYVKRLEGAYSEKAVRAFVDGEFVNLAEGAVYYGFDPLLHVQDLPIPEGAELGCGMDFNVNPMAACVFWKSGSHMHFFDEIELPNADTEFMCDLLKERYCSEAFRKQHKTFLNTIYPDATGSARKTAAPGGKSDFHYIRAAGFQISARHENPKRRDRYNAVNGKFKPKEGKATLSVAPHCRKLRKYLSIYSYELMNKQEALSHLLDSFSYPVSYLFPLDHDTRQVFRLSGV